MAGEPLHPTLWRTCRVLANVIRLGLLAQLVRRQPQSVSELAEKCALTLPVASPSLRALEARGLLKVKRIRRRVEYHISTPAEAGPQARLIAALTKALRCEPSPAQQIIQLATAFTHPSRIQIYRTLHISPKTPAQIQAEIGLSALALRRHRQKLLKRGYIGLDAVEGTYKCLKQSSPIGRALSALALS